jgi:peptidoglycan/LPS O-acetylase OafA/YrhL
VNTNARRALFIVATLLLLAAGWLGIQGGIEQWPQSRFAIQRIQTITQLAYGVLSLGVLATLAGPAALTRVTRIAWFIDITVAGGLAPVAWGYTGWGPAIFAGLATAAIAWLVLWMFVRGGRPETRVTRT